MPVFEVGKTYFTTTYHGSKKTFKVVKRAANGYITFEDQHGKRFARTPLKGWSDERVTITKGTFGTVCWTGGCTLRAADIVSEGVE